MKVNFIIFIISIALFNSCKKTTESPPVPSNNFQTEISYSVMRTGDVESQEVEGEATIDARFIYNTYSVLNNPGERDIILSIRPEVPETIGVVSRFGFEFLMSVPQNLFMSLGSNTEGTATLVNPEDYPLLLLDNDEENGRRICLNKLGQRPDGTSYADGACASEGWYGDSGHFSFEFTHHELFYDDENKPNIYTEGTFEVETGPIDEDTDERFQMSDGAFKLVIPLIM